MSALLSAALTVLALIALLAGFPILIDYWIVVIAKAIPSAFTLGVTTVLLYKAFRYPRGTLFTILGIAQLLIIAWLIKLVISANIYWLLIPIILASLVVGPKSAKWFWKILDVDRYYKSKNRLK